VHKTGFLYLIKFFVELNKNDKSVDMNDNGYIEMKRDSKIKLKL